MWADQEYRLQLERRLQLENQLLLQDRLEHEDDPQAENLVQHEEGFQPPAPSRPVNRWRHYARRCRALTDGVFRVVRTPLR